MLTYVNNSLPVLLACCLTLGPRGTHLLHNSCTQHSKFVLVCKGEFERGKKHDKYKWIWMEEVKEK